MNKKKNCNFIIFYKYFFTYSKLYKEWILVNDLLYIMPNINN